MIAASIARILFAARWLLIPFYVALVVALLALLGQDAEKAYALAIGFWKMGGDDVILAALALVDITLTASLLVLVIFSGYANFVAEVDIDAQRGWPSWMVGIDFSELKLKLLASIVAIAGIKLLEAFMDVEHESDRNLAWQAGLFGAFVIGLLLVSIADAVARHFDRPHA